MTQLTVLTNAERNKFDSPPKFNAQERMLYFSLAQNDLAIVDELRSPSTKVGFVLQLGYFRSHAKFYTAEQFRQADLAYVVKMLALN